MQEIMTKKLQKILDAIKQEEAIVYEENLFDLAKGVDQQLLCRDDLNILIGSNNVSIMTTNHLNHAHFISSVIVLKSAVTLLDTIVWAYKTYMARGFTPRYFYYELLAWLDCIEEFDLKIPNIKKLYQFMIDKHSSFVSLSHFKDKIVVEESLSMIFGLFLDALLAPNINRAIEISNQYITSVKRVNLFWQGVILPALYEIGRLWSENTISVGQEHLASSICQRVMSVHYPMILDNLKYDAATVLVACSPNELHEIGARMFADFLEIEGINTLFVGANSSSSDIIKLIEEESPIAIAISTTLVGNIVELKKLIYDIRPIVEKRNIKIILGGQAFFGDPTLLQDLDYNLYAKHISEVIRYIKALE